MTVLVIGKKDCGVCDSAKKKLDLMKIPYDFINIEEVREPHDGWRTDRSVDTLAFFNLGNCVIPTIVIDRVPYTYSAAMAKLKGKKA